MTHSDSSETPDPPELARDAAGVHIESESPEMYAQSFGEPDRRRLTGPADTHRCSRRRARSRRRMVVFATPVDAYPDVSPPMVEIISQWPGHAAEEVERLITVPVEAGMNGTPNLHVMRSISLYGLSDVRMTFDDQTDTYFARQQVSSASRICRCRLECRPPSRLCRRRRGWCTDTWCRVPTAPRCSSR